MILTTNTHLSVLTNDKSFLVIFSGGKKFPLLFSDLVWMARALSFRLSCEIWYENMWHASPVSGCCSLHTCKLCLRSPRPGLQRVAGAIRALSSRLCPIMSVLCEYQHLIYNPSAAEPDCGPDTNTRTTLRQTDGDRDIWTHISMR